MTKIIAFHLPQYHSIPENDEWWGKGFTEWTNTKKAVPLYPTHYQPREPLNDYYYNLLNPETLRWQAEIAQKYGVYGFCFYHYWFEGKQLLEKPLLLLLNNKDIEIPFCFSWANHSWTRTWLEKKDVLLEQTYGTESAWIEHFNYLLPFFKDKRYITINDKPVLIFNRPLDFANADKMIELWQTMAMEQGLKGIYFIETLSPFQKNGVLKYSEGLIESQPSYLNNIMSPWYKFLQRLLKIVFIRSKPNFNSYSYCWKKILEHDPIKSEKKVYPGSFVNWDNTARRKSKGIIFWGFTLKKFKKFLTLQLIRTKEVYKSEFLFLNAWNEWAEGTYLEPDKKYGYGYLEAVQEALTMADLKTKN